MKKFLKWTLIVVLSIVVILLVSAFVLKQKTENRLSKVYEIKEEKIVIPTDTASLMFGQRWALHCKGCHGADFSGTEFFKDDGLGEINAPNITTGVGGRTAKYTDQDWIRLIRHGVKPNGTPVFIMPSSSFNNFTAEELGCIIAYLKTISAVDKKWQDEPNMTFLGKVLTGAGAFGKVIHAEDIDHNKAIVDKIVPEVTVKYGEHLVSLSGCRDCHGPTLNGFKDPNPEAPFSPNITAGGNFGKWSNEVFIKTLRSGTTPEGKEMNKKFMPWDVIGLMNNDELTAIYKYLIAQPKLPDAKP